MDTLQRIIELTLQAISQVPDYWVYVVFAAIGGGIGTSMIAAYITYRKKWKDAEKYTKTVVGFILTGIGFLMTGALYLITHASDINNLLSVSFLSGYATTIIPVWTGILAVATKFYEFKGYKLYGFLYDKLSVWANNRQQLKQLKADHAKQSVFNSPMPRPVTKVESDNATDSKDIWGE